MKRRIRKDSEQEKTEGRKTRRPVKQMVRENQGLMLKTKRDQEVMWRQTEVRD